MATRQIDRGTPFVGRADELARLEGLLASGERLLTVTGAAGVGKSRLVRRLIETEANTEARLWQETIACDLARARSRADAIECLGSAIGFRPSSGESGEAAEDRLGHALAARGAILVVLDTFDPVAEHAAGTLGNWFRLAPDARFIVTSRTRLRLRGEVCLELSPLSSEDGVDLFVQTAQRVRADWVPAPTDPPLLTKLVECLDGIPLAIELAASRIAILSPQKMLDRIGKRFDLLRGGPSDAATRQFTLRAAFDWSWGMMGPAEQSAFAQLSVFDGGFSIDAAEAIVLLDDADVLTALEELRGRSLLSPDRSTRDSDEERFRLYASIRDYAAERAREMGVSTEVEARHRDYFLNQSEARMGEFGAPVEQELPWFAGNRDNLLAVVHRYLDLDPAVAARAALGLAHLMIHQGPFDAPLEVLEKVTAALGSTSDNALSARLSFSRGVARSGTGRLEEGDVDFEAATVAAEAAGLSALQASSRLHLGLNALRQGKLSESKEFLREARSIAEQASCSRVICRAQVSMGMCLEAGAEFDEAGVCYAAALDLARSLGDMWEEVRVRSKMGSLCSFISGREEEARQHFEWAWERSREVGDSFIEAGTAYNLGRLNLNLGFLDEADRFLERALASFRTMGNQGSAGFVRTSRGLLELDRGDLKAARQELTEAVALLRSADHRLALSYAQATDALVALALGDIPTAQARTQEALGPVVELKNRALEGLVQCVRAVTAARAGEGADFGRAREAARALLGESSWAEGRAMLAVIEALDEEGRLPLSPVPPTNQKKIARARAAWRIIGGLGAGDSGRSNPRTNSVPPPTHGELQVDAMGRWFRLGTGEVVDLSRKRTLRPLVLALVERHLEHPGEALDVDGVFQVVWAGERIQLEAKKNRVYVAIATLRKAGLDSVIETRGDGYLLRPGVVISWA